MTPIPPEPSHSLAEWMSALQDAVSISDLSIPGTHNSAAHHFSFPSVRCQRSSIKKQLENGVRFLDIRLSKPYSSSCISTGNDLQVVHGAFPVALLHPVKLSRILSDVFEFLSAHPSEAVIISLKNEGPFKWTTNELSAMLWDGYIVQLRHKWFLEPRIPQLGEVRGRAILFRRFGCPNEKWDMFGFPATSWKYNTTGEDMVNGQLLAVQDVCELPTSDAIKEKTQYVESHMIRAAQMGSNTLFVNFTTAANFWNPSCWPRAVAKTVRSGIIDALKNTTGRCGILIMDFPDSDDWVIVKNVVARNQILSISA
ncbi:PLC-like phosphodiesterase [Lipomyces tetrasporus]|uniref:PLC-like phosphodiesterase n=1 Tax=Lipomyces tetrasporus TaxID=54092 RepID=A0AAD7QVK8_9ASCO|nr:PLC-like phosphodiesterase [Lipomyces tetrasporus]KAJ8102123.1 PLC-like phosphodiesterase [Lipomyces tetrasporus]